MFNRNSGQAVVCLAVLAMFSLACGGGTSGVGGGEGGGAAGGGAGGGAAGGGAGGGSGGGTGGGAGGGSGGGTGGGTADAGIPFPTVPAAIEATSNEKVAFKFFAKGTQNYGCNLLADAGYAWTFVAPDAVLYAGADETTPDAGRHYAGPTWESATDGSKFVGDSPNAKKADSPTPTTAIPWLLIPKKSADATGLFSVITFAQRINTVGGVAPAAADCNAGTATSVSKVPYTATYYLYQAK
jgi:hypothetical protein